jgi:competence protein ComEC
LHTTPFPRLFVAFSIGVTLQIWFTPGGSWLVLSALSLAGLFTERWLPLGKRYVTRWLRSLWLYLLICSCGGLLVLLKDIHHDPRYFGPLLHDNDTLLVQLLEPLQERARSRKTIAAVRAVIYRGQAVPAKGKVLLYFEQDSSVVPACGDDLLICARLRPISHSGNPGAFDYRRYCAYKQIFHQAYIRQGHWRRSSACGAGGMAFYLIAARNWCIHTLQRYIGPGPEAALGAALLIGYRYDLDKDLVQAYTNAGVVHIIAISGMHLALIYTTLLSLLRWWPAHRFSDLLKALVVTGLLWGFALIAGAAASVLRAAVTFTFMAAGELLLRRYSSTYNTLGASAFLLVCYDPWLLMDAGFQLSYLAVLGILLCYRPLYSCWRAPYGWLDRFWQAMAVTLAAQALTLPVCLFYFQQFPNLFLPANLVIVALSTLILYGLIILLLLSPWPFAAHYAGIALKYLIRCMNRLAQFIDGLPYALTDHIYMPLYATVCAYILMGALLAVWPGGRKQGWVAAMAACLLWSVAGVTDNLLSRQRRTMIVYNVSAYTAVDVIASRQLLFVGDTALLHNKAARERSLEPARMRYRAAPGRPGVVKREGPFICAGTTRMVIVDSSWRYFVPGKKFRTDYILLSHHPKLNIMQLKDMFVFKMIIFDASNPFWQIQQWKNECSALTLRCFSVPDQGAYLINF